MSLRFVTLDATGTLFHCPDRGRIYAEVLGRHGVDASARRLTSLTREVWQELDCSAVMDRDRFATHPEGAAGWWRRYLERICEHLEVPSSRFAAAELYDRFAKPDAWTVFPEVPAAWEELRAMGLGLAVVSNWDPRLPGLLAGLGMAEELEQIVYSAEVGFEKPHPGIFESALARLGAEPGEVVHVGDSRRRDLEGAQAVGIHAALLDREGRGDLDSLADLPAWVGRMGLARQGAFG